MTESEYNAYVRQLDEESAEAPTSGNPVKIYLKRSLVAKTAAESGTAWNTICFPFAMTADQIADQFGDNVTIKELSSVVINGAHADLNFTQVNAIEANKPYIMQLDEAMSEVKLRHMTLNPSANPKQTVGGIDFIGNYINPKVMANEGGTDFYVLNDLFKSSTGNTSIKAYRAYFHVPAGSTVKSLGFAGDDATGIDLLENIEAAESTEVYDLSGRRVARPSRGLYIINGQKVLLK